jgi:hypothetical protein
VAARGCRLDGPLHEDETVLGDAELVDDRAEDGRRQRIEFRDRAARLEAERHDDSIGLDRHAHHATVSLPVGGEGGEDLAHAEAQIVDLVDREAAVGGDGCDGHAQQGGELRVERDPYLDHVAFIHEALSGRSTFRSPIP